MLFARACVCSPRHHPATKTAITVDAFKSLQTTSALCRAANVARGQLRLCEEEGLMAPQSRTEVAFRQYGTDTLDRIRAKDGNFVVEFTTALPAEQVRRRA